MSEPLKPGVNPMELLLKMLEHLPDRERITVAIAQVVAARKCLEEKCSQCAEILIDAEEHIRDHAKARNLDVPELE